MKNSVNWFEIPVVDMPRAKAFYEKVLATPLQGEDFMGTQMSIFKADGVAGALVKMPHRKPNADGALLYLNTDGKLDAVLARIEQAGGKVVMPRTEIGPQGSIAVMADTEGNQVGLHQER
jgi:predicted enzyme related to lactoylglutathione lyase